MQQNKDDDDTLDLRLAVAVDPGGCGRKRKWRGGEAHSGVDGGNFLSLLCASEENNNNNNNVIAYSRQFFCAREQMLKKDPKRGRLEEVKGLHLIHLLLISATAVDENNPMSAAESLAELYRSVSLTGDSMQRVAAYFADGLAERLLKRQPTLYEMMITKDPRPAEEFSAFTALYRASPFYQFAHFTANQAIIEAFEEEQNHNNRTLHVIDFDVSHGFQWPSLIQSLSDKATIRNPIHLRITGMGRNPEELAETEARLVNFAKGCQNLVFKFDALSGSSSSSGSSCDSSDGTGRLRVDKNSTIAVNLMFYLHTLGSSSKILRVLKSVHLLDPSIVVLLEQEGTRNTRSFMSRFMESLHYFAAMFDSLDDCLPPYNEERLGIEKNLLGKEIKRVINCDKGEEDQQMYESLDTWKGRMERVGFCGVKLSSRSVSQAKLLLKIRSHCSAAEIDHGGGGFKILERDGGRSLSLGWQDRYLITASAWNCV